MVAELQQTLGDKIRTARLRRGLSQQALALALGVHVNLVRRWETKGEVPQMRYREKVWLFLNLNPDDFPPPTNGRRKQPGEYGGKAQGGTPPEWVLPSSKAFAENRASYQDPFASLPPLTPEERKETMAHLMGIGLLFATVYLARWIKQQGDLSTAHGLLEDIPARIEEAWGRARADGLESEMAPVLRDLEQQLAAAA